MCDDLAHIGQFMLGKANGAQTAAATETQSVIDRPEDGTILPMRYGI